MTNSTPNQTGLSTDPSVTRSAPPDGRGLVVVQQQNPFEVVSTHSLTLSHTPVRSRSDHTQSTSPTASMHSPPSVPRSPHTSPTVTPLQLQHQRIMVQQQLPQSPTRQVSTVPPPTPDLFDDDETTEPSSTGNATDQPTISSQDNTHQHTGGHMESSNNNINSFTRFFGNTRRRLSSAGRGPDVQHNSTDFEDDFLEGALISGYLQKLGRNGKWQSRWFESDGESLSYFKSKKRTKLLATLELDKVGAIKIHEGDSTGCCFIIQVRSRNYMLRAENKARCKDWVITLNRIKEARLNQGNVKLVNPYDSGLYDPSEDTIAPRLIVVANRERTRAVAATQDFDQLIEGAAQQPEDQFNAHTLQRNAISTAVLARWTKRRSTLTRLSAKFANWARSITRYKCTDVEEIGVDLDKHVHPPGHDDKPSQRRMANEFATNNVQDPNHWIGREISHGLSNTNRVASTTATSSKPSLASRGISTSSDDDARYIS